MAGCQHHTVRRSQTEIQSRVELGISKNPTKYSVQFDLTDAEDVFNPLRAQMPPPAGWGGGSDGTVQHAPAWALVVPPDFAADITNFVTIVSVRPNHPWRAC